MTGTFGKEYAGAYDVLYADKNYDAEVDLIEAAIARHGRGPAVAVLDLGCGTAGHAIPLTRRGHVVTGVDLSPGMLEQARAKAASAGVDVELWEGDIRCVELGKHFDVALLMFAVLSYMHGNDDVLAALRTARRHLRDGGLLLLDVWNGPAVLVDPPRDGEKSVGSGAGELRRVARAELDVRRHLCHVHYELDGAVQAAETHIVRYYFPLELELFLDVAGFRLLALTPFGALEGEPDERTRNAFVVAQAC